MRRISLPRLPLALFLLGSITASVASAAVQDRIAAAVSGAGKVALPNSVHGRARLASDLGPAAADTRLEAMTLRFSMTDAQQAALDQLLADQQDPSSARYRQWLTPAQYAAQFGLSAADISRITAWLTSQGFTITEVANSATFVRFSGTVAQAQAAFATSIHSLSLNGETHFANVTDASVPSGIAGVVAGVTGLHNFKLKSRVRNMDHTQFTSSNTGNHFIVPGDFYGIYNETPLFTAGTTGAGVTIAVMGQTDISLTDIAAFRAAAGLAANAPTVQLYGCDPGVYNALTTANQACDQGSPPTVDDLEESSLDVEWSGATAPAAHILFVNSWDVIGISLTDAIDNNLAPIMSISYGSCEAAWGTNELNTLNQLFKQANAQGITVVGPGGDSGATDCDATDLFATQGLAVDFPASSPYVTGLGGTQFNEGNATGATSYWSATNTTINAGSAGSAVVASVLPNTYIPEAAWDEDAANQTFSAGGGGVSGFFSKPAWQQGPGVPADASRDVPDLALNSAPSHDGYIYCVSGSCASGFQGALAAGVGTVAGGTSFAAPSFAGILALVEQKTASRLGNANPMIYAMANNGTINNTTSTSAFHDITTGNNNNPCTAGTPNCPSGGTIGYSAGAGYDLATGWGSVNVTNFVGAWGTVTPFGIGTLGSGISSTTVGASPISAAAGGTITLTANLTGLLVTTSAPLVTTAGPTPTGTVQFLVNNVPVGSPVALVAGVATYPLVTSCTSLGQRIVSASYSGDATYAGSKGSGISASGFVSQFSVATPITVTVTSGTCPDFSISAPTPPTVTSGSPSVVLTVAPINGFTGTVAFSATAAESSSLAPTFTFNPSSVAILSTTASATTTLTLNNITAALRAPAAPGKIGSGHRAPWYAAGSGVAIASLLLLILPRRRRLGSLLLVALSVALIAGAGGCSSGNGTVSANTNPDVGTYVVTVLATYTSSTNVVTSHTATVTFNVQ